MQEESHIFIAAEALEPIILVSDTGLSRHELFYAESAQLSRI